LSETIGAERPSYVPACAFEGELDCATRIRAAGSVKAYVNRCKTGAADLDVIRDRVARSALKMGRHAPGVFPSNQYDSCQKLRAARYETRYSLPVCWLAI